MDVEKKTSLQTDVGSMFTTASPAIHTITRMNRALHLPRPQAHSVITHTHMHIDMHTPVPKLWLKPALAIPAHKNQDT